LREQEKREKLGVVADLVSKNGVSVDDLLNAVLSGNFEDIQSKIVKTGKATGNGVSISEASDGDNNVVVSHESSSDTDVDSGNDDNYASAM
jgi:ABC-type tungstate transport system permease subunit